MGMDRLADIVRICAHFNGQCEFTNHVASVGANNRTTNDAMALRIHNNFCKALVPAVGDCAA